MWYSLANVCIHNAEKLGNNRTGGIGLVTPTPGLGMAVCCNLEMKSDYFL